MGKYISADIIHWHDDGWACIRKDEYPTIDIVWCKECVHNGEYTDCPLNAYAKTDYSFCSYGEREESE